MKKLIITLTLAVGFVAVTESTDAQSLGLQNQWPFTPLAVPGMTTNQFPAGTSQQVFIGTSDVDFIGLQLSSITGTNQTSPSVPETISVTYAKSANGLSPDTSTVSTMTLTAKTAVASTNFPALLTPDSASFVLDVHGMAGIYILSVTSTNAANTATNYVSLQSFAKAQKVESVPSSYRN